MVFPWFSYGFPMVFTIKISGFQVTAAPHTPPDPGAMAMVPWPPWCHRQRGIVPVD